MAREVSPKAGTSVTPFLMFQGRAEEALGFYAGLFPDGALADVVRYAEGEQGPAGGLKTARLTVGGQSLMIFDSPMPHAFTFTPSFSLFVSCTAEEELDRLFAALADGGGVMMPPGAYGFSRKFAWVNDRFGVSWQLNLP